MKKFDFFNQYRDPVIVVSDYENVVFRNNTFRRVFNSFNNFKKFAHSMNFDMCPIDSENIDMCSPIFQAITSKQNFFARINYSTKSGETSYYDMTAIKRNKYTILFFTDVSSIVLLENSDKEKIEYIEELKKLKLENNELLKIKQEAQTQAFKIALINKMSNIIRESIDINAILHSALKELSLMFGCFKAYYAQAKDDTFKIIESYGEDFSDNNSTISFDNNILKTMKQHKVSIGYTLTEYDGANQYKQPVLRIITPVFHLQKIMGIIVMLSYQKRDLTQEIEILEAVSNQLSSAVIRAELYTKNSQNLSKLQKTLKELKETQLQLINSEKMASLGQLVAGIAHEINTPIASIKANNEILTKLISKIENSDIKEMFKNINNIDKEAIDRITKIVLSLKKFVRLDESDLQEADINKELDLTLEIIRHEMKNKITVEKKYSNIPKIKCYPNMLNQVFTNILINACQAIEKDGLITITTTLDQFNLIVKIKDNGIGISPENLNQIFNVGYTTKGVGVGTGLGLAISKKIIEKHNGQISVNSLKNKGTEFIITIPCR